MSDKFRFCFLSATCLLHFLFSKSNDFLLSVENAHSYISSRANFTSLRSFGTTLSNTETFYDHPFFCLTKKKYLTELLRINERSK